MQGVPASTDESSHTNMGLGMDVKVGNETIGRESPVSGIAEELVRRLHLHVQTEGMNDTTLADTDIVAALEARWLSI
jgi:hypothetical protein